MSDILQIKSQKEECIKEVHSLQIQIHRKKLQLKTLHEEKMRLFNMRIKSWNSELHIESHSSPKEDLKVCPRINTPWCVPPTEMRGCILHELGLGADCLH